MSPFVVIGLIGSAILTWLATVATTANYRIAPVFLIPLLWSIFFLRRRMHVHPFHYALFASAMVLHNLGAFGFYGRSFFGLSFDIYVHFYFGLVGTLLVRRALSRTLPLHRWQVVAGAVLLVMGFGAIHEIFEYMTWVFGGEKYSMLKPGASYFFDTSRDLLDNFLGALVALAGVGLYYLAAGRNEYEPGGSRPVVAG
jgi:uncharacterized membrane protein YjdF